MSYIDAIHIKDEIVVWERTKKGREVCLFKAPYYFYIEDDDGDYTSIYGKKLSKCEFKTRDQLKSVRADLKGKKTLYESDVDALSRVLSENYYKKEPPALHTCYFDIEVDYDKEKGFASPDNPYAPINAIAIYNDWQSRMVLIAVPPDAEWYEKSIEEYEELLNAVEPLPEDVEVDIHMCSGERDLLSRFLEEIRDSDVISGYNSTIFDVPYLAARLELQGKKWLRGLTFDEAPKPRWGEVERMGGVSKVIEMTGRISLDYLEVFKKFEVTERPSFKLESIADEVLPDMPKLEYKGSLADLYRKDFIWFIRYNLRDTEILKGFEERKGYIALANRFVHDATAQFKHLLGTLKLAEFSVINYCHHEKNVIVYDNKKSHEDIEQFAGAFVLDPQIGMHGWLASVDINSLYPSAIRAVNISPETIVGQFHECEQASKGIALGGEHTSKTCMFENGEEETHSASTWRALCKTNKWAVSGFGTVFDQHKKGIVPSILEKWYADRKQFQRNKTDAKKAIDEISEEDAIEYDKLAIKEKYWDQLQYIEKIKLNSFYGAIGNQYFRFFDLRMAQSVTATSRAILIHQAAKVNEILIGKYDSKGESVLYGDTDSVYFLTYCDNQKEAILVADRIAKLVNDSFEPYMKKTFLCRDGFSDLIKAAREMVADRGIFVAKKMYMLHVIDNEGYPSDKLKVMGLATKRTTLPKEISNYINDAIKEFLKGSTWEEFSNKIVELKKDLKNTDDIMRIGLPKGVKKVEDYTDKLNSGDKVNLPGHVAASIFWNQGLKENDDKLSPKITSGMKIKVFYLTQTYGRFKSIAIPVDIDLVPSWVFESYTVDEDAQILRLVDKPLEGICNAIGKEVPSEQNELVDNLLAF